MHSDLKTIKQRLVAAQILHAREQEPRWCRDARRDLARLQPNGRWPDIDYADQSMMGEWRSAVHLARMGRLAAAVRTAKGARAVAFRCGALSALDAWLQADFRNPNWWWNEIGVPQRVGNTLVLLEPWLTPAQLEAGLKIMARNNWSKHTGQNLVWGTSIQIVRGALAGRAAKVAQGFARMAREVRIAGPGEEGIQADFSFHQHGAVLYSGGYGLGFACDAAAFAALARGTRFAFAPGVVRRLGDYLLEGQQWMMRGSTFDYTAVGREITRQGKSGAALAGACRDMALVDPGRRAELAAFRRRVEGAGGPRDVLSGNRHFWKSDLMAHQRPGYYASVRLFSDRLDNTDWVCGGEGKRSHYLADGALFVYRRGDEFRDLFPAWDWQRVPGATVECQETHPDAKTVRSRGTKSFAGGVSDGEYGLAAMDFARGALSARKAWFFLDQEIVCLGAGITCSSDRPVRTSVSQCRARGVVLEGPGGAARRLPDGLHARRGPTWFLHDGVGYRFLGAEAARVGCRRRAGNWIDIGTGVGGKVSERVFDLWLEHGKRVAGATYAYVVVPDIAAVPMAWYATQAGPAVLANTARLQAVWHAGVRALGAAFYRAGRVKLGGFCTVAVDRPCLLLARGVGMDLVLAVADPTGKEAAVHVEIGLHLRGPGCRWLPAQKASRVTVRLPRGAEAGRSVVVRLAPSAVEGLEASR